MASAGVGSAPHVAGELFKLMTGLNMVTCPIAVAACTGRSPGGQVQMLFEPTLSTLGISGRASCARWRSPRAKRSEALPDVPTVGEFVPGYEATAWFGLGAPKGTPAEILDKLNREINAGLADPKIKARLADLGGHRCR